ncbi:MAG: hypothetical protein WCA35_23615 [Kovacikia sp.]
MPLHPIFFPSLVGAALVVGASLGAVSAHANPNGVEYNPAFARSGQRLDDSSVPAENSLGIVLTDSSASYSSPYSPVGAPIYRRPSANVSNSVLINPTLINSSIRNSTLINPTIVNPAYYPAIPNYPGIPYDPFYYPNLQIFSVQSYTRPSPEIVVDPQYGVRFKNPPGY